MCSNFFQTLIFLSLHELELIGKAFHLHGTDLWLLNMLVCFQGKKSMVFAVIMGPQSTLPHLTYIGLEK